jgi:hypothetical protein
MALEQKLVDIIAYEDDHNAIKKTLKVEKRNYNKVSIFDYTKK